MNWLSASMCKKIGIFAGGVLFGTAGVKLLSGREARNVYVQTTAAALRVKECVMTTVTKIRENAGDIYADAQDLNVKLAAEAEKEIEDCSCECNAEENV